jgi:hypothetical protein
MHVWPIPPGPADAARRGAARHGGSSFDDELAGGAGRRRSGEDGAGLLLGSVRKGIRFDDAASTAGRRHAGAGARSPAAGHVMTPQERR